MSNFFSKYILNLNKTDVKFLVNVFEDSNFSQEEIDKLIFLIFLTDSKDTQDVRDFY